MPTRAYPARRDARGGRSSIGAAPERKAPATADLVMEMLKHCPPTLAGKRDRALLALGFAGAFRRSELIALEVADLAETPDGLRVTIRRSKTDQEGEGAEVAILRSCRPARASLHARVENPPGDAGDEPKCADHPLNNRIRSMGWRTTMMGSGISDPGAGAAALGRQPRTRRLTARRLRELARLDAAAEKGRALAAQGR